MTKPLLIAAALVAGLHGPGPGGRPASAGQGPPPTAAIAAPQPGRDTFPTRRKAADRAPADGAGGSAGWWLGTAGVALALAACGGISVALRRYLPQASMGPLRVIGRTSLSPKHTLYLLQAGERVLIVGAGPQGPPALLGELGELGQRAAGGDA